VPPDPWPPRKKHNGSGLIYGYNSKSPSSMMKIMPERDAVILDKSNCI
jgi:hypothetical protein